MGQQTSPRMLTSPESYDESPGSLKSLRSEASLTSVARSISEMSGKASNIHSQTSLSSQGSSTLNSENSLRSQSSSIFSQLSIQSHVSVQSQVSIASQMSLQSELSLYSQSSLGFLPSLGNFHSDGKVKGGTDYRCISTLKGSDGHVSCLALAGELLFSGFGSHNIRVWLNANLVEYSTFGSGDGAVKALVVAGERVFSAHQDHKIRVWKKSRQQLTAYKLMTTMPTVKDYLMTFIPPKNYVQIRRHKKSLWIEHVDSISVLAVGKNDVLYSGSWDRTVKVWRLSDFKCLESFKAHDDAINALVVSSDGFLCTGSADAKVKVWVKPAGAKKHSLVTTLESHKSAVNALAFSSDGSILYSGACDRAIIVWEREDSAQHIGVAGALRGHRHAILCLASVGDTLCSGSADKTIRVWRREAGTLHSCVAVLQGHRGPVKCISVTMNATMDCLVYSGSLDQDIKVWQVCGSKDDAGNNSQDEASPEETPQPFKWKHEL